MDLLKKLLNLPKDIVTSVSNDANFAVGKPILVDIFDPNTGALLSPKELCTFLHIDATEPFETSFAVLRYGLIKTSETQVVPFVVGAVQDDVVASKEFLIAEQFYVYFVGILKSTFAFFRTILKKQFQFQKNTSILV